MIGIDTNILLRFILADDAVQLQHARAFLSARSADDPAFVPGFVILIFLYLIGFITIRRMIDLKV